jgi:YfiH family protein
MSRPLGVAARLVASGDALFYRAPALSVASPIVHGVTHASLGNFSLSAGEERELVLERRRRLLDAAGLKDARVVAPPLHHTAGVAVVREGRLPPGRHDALVCGDPRTVLAVTVADCVAVFFADVEGAYGVAHAGWRGLAAGIVRRTIETMRNELGVKLGNLLVGTGPAIRGPSYEVGPEVAGLFPEEVAVPAGEPGSGRARLDLPTFALGQASACGVPRDNLVDFSLCTATHPGDLFSHRRGDTSRHWAFVGRP